MNVQSTIPQQPELQRAKGLVSVYAKHRPDGASLLQTLRHQGSLRAIFPRPAGDQLETVLVNTAGGITGGDQFSTHIVAQAKTRVSVTTQAAERIYRAAGVQHGTVTTSLSAQDGAALFWLPQETILFDGARLKRRLDVELHASATFLMVEALVFGRCASGERLMSGALDDRVTITRDSTPLYFDRIKMGGKIAEQLNQKAVADGARAMASIVFVDPLAKPWLDLVRPLLPPTAGTSLLSDTVLVVRVLAPDSLALRKSVFKILHLLTDAAVPKNWRL